MRLFGVTIPEEERNLEMRKVKSMGNLEGGEGSNGGDGNGGERECGYVSDGLLMTMVPSRRKWRTTESHERKKAVPWTEEEHRKFLAGLEMLGKGDWRGIAKNFVTTRTPTQVASHAQKYFLRKSNPDNKKRRSSLFDLTKREKFLKSNSLSQLTIMKASEAVETSNQVENSNLLRASSSLGSNVMFEVAEDFLRVSPNTTSNAAPLPSQRPNVAFEVDEALPGFSSYGTSNAEALYSVRPNVVFEVAGAAFPGFRSYTTNNVQPTFNNMSSMHGSNHNIFLDQSTPISPYYIPLLRMPNAAAAAFQPQSAAFASNIRSLACNGFSSPSSRVASSKERNELDLTIAPPSPYGFVRVT